MRLQKYKTNRLKTKIKSVTKSIMATLLLPISLLTMMVLFVLSLVSFNAIASTDANKKTNSDQSTTNKNSKVSNDEVSITHNIESTTTVLPAEIKVDPNDVRGVSPTSDEDEEEIHDGADDITTENIVTTNSNNTNVAKSATDGAVDSSKPITRADVTNTNSIKLTTESRGDISASKASKQTSNDGANVAKPSTQQTNSNDTAAAKPSISRVELNPTKPSNLILRDDTSISRARVVTREENPALKLSTIFYGKSTKVAIINGNLLKEGDVIADKEVVKINKQTVVLQDRNNKADMVELSLIYKDIKQAYAVNSTEL